MALDVLELFNIDIFKLKNGVYNYPFEIGNSFFTAFPESALDKGNGKVEVTLEKTDTFIKLAFKIKVEVELECDRSLDLFYHPIKCKRQLILKFGEEEEDITEEISIISRDRQRLNLGQYIYEFIGLSVPMKKLHPRFENDEENEGDSIVYSSGNDSPDDDSEEIDPRWKKLKNLK